jgi:hypothetical protein
LCASISDIDAVNAYNLYPNPSKGNFTIVASTIMNNLHIYNELGMLVKEIENVNSTNYVVKSTFEKGVYFVYSTSEVGTRVQKLIID